MSYTNSKELLKKTFKGKKLSGRLGRLLGFVEPKTSILIWGEKYTGKSTFSLILANRLAEEKGKTIYFSPEEGVSFSMKDKIERTGAAHKDLIIADWTGLEGFKNAVLRHKAKAAFVDSAQMAKLREKELTELYEWCRKELVILVIVNHATKDGQYKGSSMSGHMVDIELQVLSNGVVVNKKNRQGGQGEYQIDFGSKKQKKEHSTPQKRTNPVPVPFTTTLKQLDETHRIQHATRLNQLADYKLGCTAYRKNRSGTGTSEDPQPVSFRYTRRQIDGAKVSILELLLNETIVDQTCEKDFKTAWKKMVNRNPDVVIVVDDQSHAKKVLGAKEYRKQEKKAGQQQQQPKKQQAAKKTAKKTGKAQKQQQPARSQQPEKKQPPKKAEPKKKAPMKEFDEKIGKVESLLEEAVK